jgi:hypothetical protein
VTQTGVVAQLTVAALMLLTVLVMGWRDRQRRRAEEARRRDERK